MNAAAEDVLGSINEKHLVKPLWQKLLLAAVLVTCAVGAAFYCVTDQNPVVSIPSAPLQPIQVETTKAVSEPMVKEEKVEKNGRTESGKHQNNPS